MPNGNKRIPDIGMIEYRIIFYHSKTKDIMKYKFTSKKSAINFFDKLNYNIAKPIMYEIVRTR